MVGTGSRIAYTITVLERRLAAIQLVLAALFCLLLPLSSVSAQQKKREAQGAKAAEEAVSPEEAAKLEAVVETELGTFRFEFFPDKAPNHVKHFIKLARQGYYDGSAFFRAITRAFVQGGDPLLKNPATPKDRWGTGGLNLLAEEISDVKHIRGTVSTARIPNKPGSDGAQFFITLYPIAQYDGQYSAFGQVNEGLEVVEKISLVETDEQKRTIKPVKIISVRIEPKKTEPFKDATPDMMQKDVLLRTSLGDITVQMDPSLAPEHVRNFLKLVETGWYNRTEFHRLLPGFVAQGGVGQTRAGSQTHPADRWVRNLKGEFSKVLHTRGTLSMARGDDPNSANTSFFLVLGNAPHLDGKYTVFGKIIDGFDTLEKIEKSPRNGERPVERIELIEAVIKP